ncbi:uncharacterized protein LOC135388946 isoform X4 [Ornithodoros turicata]|uniref:uncharacterized protein LOC135388946 isoform X4 n=1 Tax=Ornithodoros turicata TaxID=34597 RepID=UPI003139F67D
MPTSLWKKQYGTRRFVIAYTVIMVLTTIVEAKFGYDAIYEVSDYSDRPDRLSRLSLHIGLQTIHVCVCLYWIQCAKAEYVPGLECAFSAMLIRTGGNYVHSLCTVTYESFILPRTVVNVIRISSWIPTDLRLWYATFWLVIEVSILVRLYLYSQALSKQQATAMRIDDLPEVQPQEDPLEGGAMPIPDVATVPQQMR